MAGGAHTTVFLVVGLALIFAVHVVVVIWALYRARASARVAGHLEEARAGGVAGLSAEEVAELPCHEFKEGGGGTGDCAVCLEAFRDGDRCRVLPGCEHAFHAHCVDSWLRKSRLCPICRAVVAAHGKETTGNPAATVDAAALEIVTER